MGQIALSGRQGLHASGGSYFPHHTVSGVSVRLEFGTFSEACSSLFELIKNLSFADLTRLLFFLIAVTADRVSDLGILLHLPIWAVLPFHTNQKNAEQIVV